jgi:hypothetical protein
VQVTILFADFFIALLFEITLELQKHDVQDGYRAEALVAFSELLAPESDNEARAAFRHTSICKDLFVEKPADVDGLPVESEPADRCEKDPASAHDDKAREEAAVPPCAKGEGNAQGVDVRP